MVKLMHKDILYAQSMKDYMIIRTTNRNYITHMTMKYLAGLLPEKLFKRVHRSFLIGTSHITSIGRNEIMIGEAQIPIGESYKEEVNKLNIPMK
jgi:two-component system LytT family response regulator